MALRRRPHVFAIDLVVPPGIAEIRGHHVCARMNVAHHALTGGNRSCELVTHRMPRFLMRNRWVLRRALSQIAELCKGSRVLFVPIVRIDNVAPTATARPVVTRLIVGSRE